jgi:hypothetical protein
VTTGEGIILGFTLVNTLALVLILLCVRPRG